ncbi:SDR family oxidoreductase [Marisediminicola senii]|uniref:SDR family oxidoreductase n=1 Tax=Marisediminicola senii TaxID=2711233 RepID=UPI0013EC12D1|nr:SDR family oxidoreductase [Marisediminicola senii]
MTKQSVLFIGGTGIISSAASALAAERGFEVTLLNRGQSPIRPVPQGVEVITGDIRDPESVAAAIGDRRFDVVADFLSFTPEHVQANIDRFEGKTGQYIFISSASAYQTPPARLPITESTPLNNPEWQYSRDKIACENLLVEASRERGFPVTIVRPSHTYDGAAIPLMGGWTAIDRMRRGLPVIVHGDGSSLWALTHTRDFAKAFVGLLGNPLAIGDSFHITSDAVVTWNQVATMLADAAGVTADIVHVTSDTIAALVPDEGPSLLGDKTHSVIFDNSKVRSLVPDFVATIPFAAGAREIVEWHDAHPNLAEVDPEVNAVLDRLVATVRPAAN